MKSGVQIYRKSRSQARKTYNALRQAWFGVRFLPPNYVYLERFNEQSGVVDVGCGHVAEFSQHLIQAHHVRAFGVDPTRKHAAALQRLQDGSDGKFRYLPLAVSKQTGALTFYESAQNESGSMLSEHTNVVHDDIRSYPVEAVSLVDLAARVGGGPIDLVKLDLEGAEYELLQSATTGDLASFKQVFVEFHHHCTAYSIQDTEAVVEHLRGLQLKSFTLDHHNFLFYR